MKKFQKITSTVVPIPIENIDTDQIIPARYLKETTRGSFGDKLFSDWRYDKNNNPVSDFILNKPEFKGKILVAGKNFGCGSSREHAVWALYDYGFRVIISSHFADIFRNNALNNGLLTIQISPSFLEKIFECVYKDTETQLEVDLETQLVKIVLKEIKEEFSIDQLKKYCMLSGNDYVEFLIGKKDAIEGYENNKNYFMGLSDEELLEIPRVMF
jgi:3-isopropylmalate/(R)-2-methylmalate dehydratase small subunit